MTGPELFARLSPRNPDLRLLNGRYFCDAETITYLTGWAERLKLSTDEGTLDRLRVALEKANRYVEKNMDTFGPMATGDVVEFVGQYALELL